MVLEIRCLPSNTTVSLLSILIRSLKIKSADYNRHKIFRQKFHYFGVNFVSELAKHSTIHVLLITDEKKSNWRGIFLDLQKDFTLFIIEFSLKK